jgi:DNA excision repair protein ERCC-3
MTDESADGDPAVTLESFHDALQDEGRPVATAQQIARRLGCTQAAASEALDRLVADGDVQRLDVESDPVVWYPTEWGRLAERERVVLFPERREFVVDQPSQYTRAQLSRVAHLVDTSGTKGYLYRIRQEDVWAAPFDDCDALLRTLRSVLPRRSPHLEEWIERQWTRARQLILTTHEDGYTVPAAATESPIVNVACQ